MKKLSVCIPTHEMSGQGHIFLKQSFNILIHQTFKDFDIVISDNAKDDSIKNVCEQYKDKLDIIYVKNPDTEKRMGSNINNAIKNATGNIIKILFLDDFLYDNESLEYTVKNFDLEKDCWLVSACEHTTDGTTFIRPFYPRYNKYIHLGKNTISSPSVLAIKNENPLLFDENLSWLIDCDYYKRCYNSFGKPKVLDTITVVNRMGSHQTTHTTATLELRYKEYKYILNKYEKGIRYYMLFAAGYAHYIISKMRSY